jgi:hypothetical protein
MPRSKQTLAGDTQRTVSAGVLEALGKGFLIATAGLLAGLMFGTAHMPAISLWTVAVAAASGVGCMVGSALINHAEQKRWTKKPGWMPHAANVRKLRPAMPAVEAATDVAPEEFRARRMVMDGRQREHGSGRGVTG